MARPIRIEYPGAFYHVFNRGLEKREIFLSSQDDRQFLSLSLDVHRKYKIVFHAYCLMPNHYHLMLETPLGNLSRAMRHLDGIYTQFFNRKYERVGPLFQGRYRAILVEKESYALELSRYLHLNPVKARLCQKAEDYPFSSFPAYLGLAPAPAFLETDRLLEQFDSVRTNAAKTFYQFTWEGLRQDWEPAREARAGCVLGRESFFKEIREKFIRRLRGKEYAGLRTLSQEEKEEIVSKTVRQLHCRPSLRAKLLAYALFRFAPFSLEEIRQKIGAPTYAAVSKSVSRLEAQRKRDVEVDLALKRIERELEKEMSNV